MTKAAYGVGDRVVLVDGPVKTGRPDGEFTILACLPDINGMAQYRVKSLIENFERRIVSSEIDMERSPPPARAEQTSPDLVPTGSSWVKTTGIKVGR